MCECLCVFICLFFSFQEKATQIRHLLFLCRCVSLLIRIENPTAEDKRDFRKMVKHLAVYAARHFTGYEQSQYWHKLIAHAADVSCS